MIDLNNDLHLDQLVEGECTIDQEIDALVQCESDPELWRAVAISFIEHRRLAHGLAASVAHRPSTPTQTALSRWAIAASVFLMLGTSTFAWMLGRGKRNLRPAPQVQSVFIEVPYPVGVQPDSAERSIEQIAMFDSKLAADVADMGFDVQESIRWQTIPVSQRPNETKLIPSREVRFVSRNQSD